MAKFILLNIYIESVVYKTLFALQILTHLFHMTIMRGKTLLLLYILTDRKMKYSEVK